MKVVVANPGAGVYIMETVRAYKEHQALENFYTSFVSNINIPFYQKLQTSNFAKELQRRAIDDDLIPFVKTSPFKELLRTFSSKFLSEETTDNFYQWSEYSFDKWVASQLDSSIDVVHCYEHASLETIKRAKKLGIFVVYEQPSQHHSFLTPKVSEQFKLYPKLGDGTNSLLLNEKSVRRNKRRDEELALADLIICNSSFTKSTLLDANIDATKIKVIPLGFPSVHNRREAENKKIRFIYAGTSNIRKGIHLLIDVWKENYANRNDIEIYFVGRFDLPSSYKDGKADNMVFIDSIPRAELLESFCDADVLILPTLADGFGMVITEAMSRGLCVMCTENSAGPDIINHGTDGLVFKANSKSSIKELLDKWSTDKLAIKRMGMAAKERAKGYQWKDFRKNLVNTINQELNVRK
jgi:glycosyltransferase involved in cell wall biosynthesis